MLALDMDVLAVHVFFQFCCHLFDLYSDHEEDADKNRLAALFYFNSPKTLNVNSSSRSDSTSLLCTQFNEFKSFDESQ